MIEHVDLQDVPRRIGLAALVGRNEAFRKCRVCWGAFRISAWSAHPSRILPCGFESCGTGGRTTERKSSSSVRNDNISCCQSCGRFQRDTSTCASVRTPCHTRCRRVLFSSFSRFLWTVRRAESCVFTWTFSWIRLMNSRLHSWQRNGLPWIFKWFFSSF